ncbi:hypothetical protein OP10G_1169 [Fimbriimonas ginsengisoli Gsoil 348]|uniref:Uncharacterized protein n=1 Tax=Fimbriimonas ginsengisoli Gsoil 348 TaxID=661478 RepID=A0A068NMC2_FIMGI|nr:hypothetical protein OP10G_1169 [Fimbriimonas ginsengisoli Gsoil 348]
MDDERTATPPHVSWATLRPLISGDTALRLQKPEPLRGSASEGAGGDLPVLVDPRHATPLERLVWAVRVALLPSDRGLEVVTSGSVPSGQT